MQLPATLDKADMAIRRWLTSKRLSFPELIIENGSGLSRNERISARHLGQLLLAAFQSPVMPEFVSSLPIAAVDGTMKKRLNGSAAAGQAHIKTGLLDGVRTMAGYVLNRSGQARGSSIFNQSSQIRKCATRNGCAAGLDLRNAG